MKCPDCGFNTLDYADSCKKCGKPLKVKPLYKAIYKPIRAPETRENPRLDVLDPFPAATPPLERVVEEPLDVQEDLLKTTDPFISAQYDLLAEESSEFGDAPSFDLAPISQRISAFLIDVLVLLVVTGAVLWAGFFFAGIELDLVRPPDNLIRLYAILFFLASSYFVFLQGFSGKTIGKAVLGMRVIRDDGKKIGLWEAFIRWLGYFVSAVFMLIGLIWAIFDSRCQTWHDKIAGTFVVKG